ncbi:recombinase family protein [Streptomyces sp. ISL-44]|uniref:recombinase family protein n=1 Tax=Streptomyces sp. ISL-44 TaxID=2819184 RepID=UPI001BEC7958|nr:recombinase family protein [Streptomyces sp. ISL-44]MBT2539172.1 recombinase family protein [Streptomyces sp. ISL-44]
MPTPARPSSDGGSIRILKTTQILRAPIRRKMVDMAIRGADEGDIEGATYVKIRDYLVEINAITPRNHRAALARSPREPDPDDVWHVETVRKMLKSATTRGHLVKRDGTPVLTATGEPVLQGESLIDDQTWYDLQEALKQRHNGSSGVSKRKDAHPLLDVLICGICERNVHRHFVVERKGKRKGLRYENFRCTGLFHPVDDDGKRRGLSILADPVMGYVDEWFLSRFGDVRRTEVVTRGGVDNRSAITELEAAIANMGRNLAVVTGPAAELLVGQLNAMSQRLAVLQQHPYEPPRQEVVELPGTWGDDWRTADWEGRRAMLLSVGVRIKLGKLNGWRRAVGERLAFEVGHSATPAAKGEDAMQKLSWLPPHLGASTP